MSKFIEYINEHEWFRELAIKSFSTFHSFTNEEILLYKDILKIDDANLLSNENIKWDIDLIESINTDEVFSGLYKLNNIDFDFQFFKRNLKKFRKGRVNSLSNIQWSADLLELLDKKIDWKQSYIVTKIPPEYTLNILRTKVKKLNWKWLSRCLDINFTTELIDEFSDLWDWSELSSNRHLNIDVNFLKTYKDKIDWKNISRNKAAIEMITEYPNSKSWDWNEVIINPGITYDALNFETIFKYFTSYQKKRTNVHPFLSKNPLSSFIFRIFYHQNNDISFFLRHEMFKKYIPYEYLTKNGNLMFSFDFINDNKDKLNFHDSSFIKKHIDIFSEQFIYENFELFDSKSFYFYYLPISSRIVEKYKEQISFFSLAGCENFDWTLDFIIEHDELNLYKLGNNKSVYNLFSSNLKFTDLIKV
jgi:hypothetical protein